MLVFWRRGLNILAALKFSDLLEEMKSDLVSLFSARRLHAAEQHDSTRFRGFMLQVSIVYYRKIDHGVIRLLKRWC